MYNNFAYIYDKLMYDVNYKEWADYIEQIFKVNEIKPSLVLDLGCGTGSFCTEMAQRGYEMIGIDMSAEMLMCAKDKATKKELDILYLNQDMADFELYGTVDAIVCLMDSINYITNIRDVKRIFKLVQNYLNPGGLFIFDINSYYKLEKVLGNNVFYSMDDDISYIWQNQFDKRRKICEFDLAFFVKENDSYKRYDEIHYERAFEVAQLKKLLNVCGLDCIKVYDGLTFSSPGAKSERIFFVSKK